MENIFAEASRKKLRFNTVQGLLSLEDLWDLPLTSSNPRQANLNSLAKALNRERKASEEEDFVEDVKKQTTVTELQFNVVKFVIDTRKVEREAAKVEAEHNEEIQQLLSLIHDKEHEELKNMPLDELKAKLAEKRTRSK